MKIALRIGVAVLALVVLGYAGVVGYMYVNQRALQYSATGEITDLADAAIAGAEEIALPSGDGVLSGWYAPPSEGMPVILYYKGNSGSFSGEYERYAAWTAAGYGFLAFDYRGFPTSEGVISEEGILEDAEAAYRWAVEQGYPLVIWGRSLGSGPATYIASIGEADGLLLETPFLSAVSVAAERYPYLPVGLVMLDQFPSNEWIADVEEPVFVVHGTDDSTIGVSNGERLYALAPNPAHIWIVEGGEHGDLWDFGLWDRAQAFFASVRD